ncbi:hypothetical protein [Riemerella anatipestifer]|uniref:hypothetical protein n=1 Tax=Riemerella anatipestifer TaxID=34085 RepID=UPI001AD72F19|nr:hypothetical protein [Riemerella anatipestifer]MBO4233309.1 hypothetical protein [Riemerella anatipestifer]MBT0551736.1 hypothetical protein [Riemerella anatipestifer]MBT0553202.1 hypothetical protein [Riemerella anatipestifer]MDY3528598.1 hypothetical protein [Riemerella anatipestifer]QYR01794.1 hypothetical protein J6M00_06140 [Riemerella anatipestifer]
MKKSILSLVLVGAALAFTSCCKDKCEKSCKETCEKKEAVASDSTKVENQEVATVVAENVLTQNVGKYPKDLGLLDKSDLSERIKTLTGDKYAEIVANFNVETPVVSENDVYKTTGCKKNSCSDYMTTILYDKKNDNLNVLVTSNDAVVKEYNEKGKINYTETLKSK